MDENNDNSGTEREKEVIDLQAVADDTTKRCGEAIEAAFLAVVCKLRIPVCKPWGDSERYDFVVDWGKGFWRVQVKAATYCSSSKNGSMYHAAAGSNGQKFTKEDMDFVVVHIVPLNIWYVVPIEIAEGSSALWFNPRGTGARFEKYRDAWCLLDSGRRQRGYADIPLKCRSKAVKVQCAVCPLREGCDVAVSRKSKSLAGEGRGIPSLAKNAKDGAPTLGSIALGCTAKKA